jgi:hypothetical protein
MNCPHQGVLKYVYELNSKEKGKPNQVASLIHQRIKGGNEEGNLAKP